MTTSDSLAAATGMVYLRLRSASVDRIVRLKGTYCVPPIAGGVRDIPFEFKDIGVPRATAALPK